MSPETTVAAASLARRHNPADIEWALVEAHGPLLPPAADRAAWQGIAERAGRDRVRAIVAAAREAAEQGVPAISASLHLDFSRNGTRELHREPFKARRTRLARLALAECLEAEGRYLDAILDLTWAICEESSWALPAHQPQLAAPGDGALDLTAAMTALDLAELVVLLEDRLEPGLATRVRFELDRRCFTPYLERNDHHWLFHSSRFGVNNWAAVCNAGVLGAALHLESDRRRTAQMVHKGLRSLDDYLATFSADGGTSEGPGYWTYGFGYFTILSDLLKRATGGLLAPLQQAPAVRDIARFPLRTVLEPGAYTTFSDTDPDVRFWRAHLQQLAAELDLPELAALGAHEPSELQETDLARSLRGLLWETDEGSDTGPAIAAHDWLPELQWMVARLDPGEQDSLVLAAKGGHNGEMHNHNDVGSVIVRSGGETLLPDLGKGRYTKEYFGPQRYDVLVRSSLGHSVPVVNGRPQGPARFEMKGDGHRFRGEVVEHGADESADTLELELAAAYGSESGLESLTRRVSLERDERRVRLVDSFRFAAEPGVVESVLVTLAAVHDRSGEPLILGARRALRVTALTPRLEIEVNECEGVELTHGPRTVRRLILRHPPAMHGRIELLLTPVAMSNRAGNGTANDMCMAASAGTTA